MKIGELAKATGTPVETIRYYEREGLLPVPCRSEGNYRVYDDALADRLAFIRHCRCLDMTLEEIRVILGYRDAPSDDCAGVDELLDDHIGHVVSRIKELKALERELRSLRANCGNVRRSTAHCGVLGGLERAAREHDHGKHRAQAGGGARSHGRRTAKR